MKYLVTGATGLVGSHAAERLAREGAEVRALVRRPTAPSAGIEPFLGDLSDEARLRAALTDVSVVVHAAGAVDMTAPKESLWEVNVRGTERLLRASLSAGVSRFVYLSSVAVYGAAEPPVREDAEKGPTGAYPESKWEAERLVARYGEHGPGTVVLRPCVIYGERDRHVLSALSRIGRLKLLPLPRGGSRLLDLVHAEDVAEAVLAAASRPGIEGRAYNVTDGEAHTQREILSVYGRVTGRRPAILSIPGSVFGLVGLSSKIASVVSPAAGRRLGRLRALDVDLHYSIEAARRELGYQPRIDLATGLTRALRWAQGAVGTALDAEAAT